ncbi:MAG: T9SS type A sorting domain-containing protein [Bacteroidia bacterium]
MKKIYQLSLLSAMIFTNVFLYGQSQVLDVPVVRQEQTQWCWAADSRCVLKFYGVDQSQCSIVEYARSLNPSRFGSRNCCPTSSSNCNQTNFTVGESGIEGMLKHFGNLNPVVIGKYIPVSRIDSEFTAKRPFIIAIYWTAGGGHVVVGCGYNSSTKALTFMDSWQGNGITTAKYAGSSSISTRSGSGKWSETVVLTDAPLGIKNTANLVNTVSAYPNPTSSGDVTIQSTEKIKSIKVYNNLGQLVINQEGVSTETAPVHISASGFYSIQTITVNNQISNNKVIVK